MVNIVVLEAGVIFHSLLIGLTLVVAGDSTFTTLFVVILFHQMFEGIALSTRIATLGQPRSADSPVHPHGYGLGHHGHFHEPKQSMPTTLAEELGAASDHPHLHSHAHDHSTAAHPTPRKPSATEESDSTSQPPETCVNTHTVFMRRKFLLATAFALVTPVGMAIGIGVLKNFNGNDPSTIIAIGTLDALSAGILAWVGVVEMRAHGWMLGGEMTTRGPLRTCLGMGGLVAGLALMSLLGMWA
ncbi:high-affinity Zn(2+) transporter zrt1 [Madurella fahalii]|uniref:High-affinity Zn(2+) transporter zrt1 n=1 Tax=Madurella fahalii TaxID=1157608 RepID=A0ABQ0G6U2_9PEZI